MSAQADAWSPTQYDRFRAERSAPFFDLLAMVRPRAEMDVVDLGCGTGELTLELHRKLDARRTLGIDNSDNMLAKAQTISAEGLSFQKGDLADFAAQAAFDLIFSNAAIQWAPEHPALLRRLTAALRESGQIAVQMPANDDHVTHEAARAVARQEPFNSALAGWTRPLAVLPPDVYASILNDLGYSQQQVRLIVYPHVLESRDGVVEWVKGTLLTDYQRRLPAELWPSFLSEYRRHLFAAIPDTRPYFYPFKRILFWAQR